MKHLYRQPHKSASVFRNQARSSTLPQCSHTQGFPSCNEHYWAPPIEKIDQKSPQSRDNSAYETNAWQWSRKVRPGPTDHTMNGHAYPAKTALWDKEGSICADEDAPIKYCPTLYGAQPIPHLQHAFTHQSLCRAKGSRGSFLSLLAKSLMSALIAGSSWALYQARF